MDLMFDDRYISVSWDWLELFHRLKFDCTYNFVAAPTIADEEIRKLVKCRLDSAAMSVRAVPHEPT